MNTNFSLSAEDVEVLCASIDLLISNPIEGVDPKQASKNELIASAVKNALRNKKTNFTAEDLRIMYVSLLNLQIIIDETNSVPTSLKFVKDSKKYSSIITRLLTNIELILESNGIHIN